jgi:type IV pilus assembly protein PilY1
MRRVKTTLTGSVVAAGAMLVAGSAGAQLNDLSQPLPNLLVALDSSGSMERMADGTMPVTCDPNSPSDLNRWGTVIEVLTGTIQNRGCTKVTRNEAWFDTEYSLLGESPYDIGYFMPWHHYSSNGCLSTRGDGVPSAAFNWGQKPIKYRPWNDYSNSAECGNVTWSQNNDGLLDTYRDRVRFSMMMFDSRTDDGVGFQGQATAAQDGFAGHWSYYNGWQNGGSSPKVGHPADCSIANQMWEVGARNFAAPPWEGRMVPFGPSQANISYVRLTNDRIQQIITALRPYGGTPIAGVMDDIWVYFHEDMSAHPDPLINEPFAPAGDPLVTGECRKSFVLLLSDGEPNLDLRPYCDQLGLPPGKCPYVEPWERSGDLFKATPSVPTFTVGFGLSSDISFDCNTLNLPTDIQPGGACDGATGGLKACCNLTQIAYEGGTDKAFFADDQTSLKAALALVLDAITSQTTSRTLPVFAGSAATSASSNQDAVGYEFGSAFTPNPGNLWSGALERKRWACKSNIPVLEPIDDNLGDDFGQNLNDKSTPRRFITVVGDSVNGDVFSDQSIRPKLSQNDGMGIYDGTTTDGVISDVASAVGAAPTSMGINTAPPPLPAVCTSPLLAATTAAECAEKIMIWELGGSNGGAFPSRAGNEFGAIYHSTPVVHGRPTAFIRDPAYALFATQQAKRPLVLYTATVDGQLHAFKVASNDSADPDKVDTGANNELWAFLPPAVLPGIPSQYPATPTILLDGAPVVKDVAFERTNAQALAGGSAGGAPWRTVLVAGAYTGGGFYYALDVTDPTSPEFLWQLSKDSNGAPLFGNISGTPAITTLSIDEGAGPKEVAVAILPGGFGALCNGTPVRQNTSFGHIVGFHDGNLASGTTTLITPAAETRCWSSDGSNSVTIVRLEDGKVLRHFRGTVGAAPASLDTTLITDAPFDSPIVHAVPFPNDTGSVSSRVYLGDEDGTLWRIDLSSTSPAAWDARIFFDGYPASPNVISPNDTDERRAIPVKPVISVDGLGNTIILYSTGDNEDFSSLDTKATVWSLTEVPVTAANGAPFKVFANWVVSENTSPALAQGERVVGPISVFDEVAYFATFLPPANVASCSYGEGKVYAVDFQANTGNTPLSPPEARFPDGLNGFKYNPDSTDSPDLDGRTVFGVAVTAEPTCIDEVTVTDDYVGQHNTVKSSVPPVFKLRFQTGAEGQAQGGSAVNTGELNVPQPRVQGHIDSWASVVE